HDEGHTREDARDGPRAVAHAHEAPGAEDGHRRREGRRHLGRPRQARRRPPRRSDDRPRSAQAHDRRDGVRARARSGRRARSAVRTVYHDGSFVEGWAVYSEWLMAKNGFGGPKVRMQQLKMLLRVATNAVLDHAVHTGSMEEKDALALMMNEGFQEEGEAVGK